MHFLPKANPLYEHVSARNIAVPEVLEKLGRGGFTGYLSHHDGNFEAYCILARGKLICVIATENGKETTGFEAIARMFDRIISQGGELNVYRMTADVAMCVHALVAGTHLFNGETVRQVDMKDLLARLKHQMLNGVVRFYTDDRYAIIFYKEGQPIGFCHDGTREIVVSPEESRKIAALAGAKLDVRATKPIDELMHLDLLQMVNLRTLWDTAGKRHASSRNNDPPRQELPSGAGQQSAKLPEMVADLEEIAVAYLSKEGRTMIGQLLQDAGGATILLDSSKTVAFLKQVEQGAIRIDSQARIEEMIDLMQSEIAGRLAV